MLSELYLLLSQYTFLVVITGTSVIGAIAGALGSFAVLRKQSLLGDCIAHAALPGICLAFLLASSKATWVLLIGALIAGGIGAIFLHVIQEYSDLKRDAALGIVLSVFFGVGLVLLTYIQSLSLAQQSGLNVFLFGNAATLLKSDVMFISCVTIGVLACVVLFWKEFKVVSFDADFASTLGFPKKRIDLFITLLTVIAIVIGLQAVGVVLMSALIIAPAVAARQWTDRLSVMVFLSALFGTISGVLGVSISAVYQKIPTGPVIVIVVSIIVLISLLMAPNRGIIVAYIRHWKQRFTIKSDRIMTNMYQFSEIEKDPTFPHDVQVLEALGEGSAESILKRLEKNSMVYSPKQGVWGLTKKGVDHVRRLIKEQQSA